MLVSSLTFPICFGCMVFADDIIRVALTDKWLAAAPILRILCVYGLIRSIDLLFPAVLRARYRTAYLLGYCLSLLAIMPGSFLFGAWAGGAIGVALAWVIAYPVVVSRMIQEVLKEIGLTWGQLWGHVSLQFIGGSVMAFAVLVVRSVLPGGNTTELVVRLTTGVAMGAIVYGAIILTSRGPLRQEIGSLTARVISAAKRKSPQPQNA
jgi:lipopolysaccharide exporter